MRLPASLWDDGSRDTPATHRPDGDWSRESDMGLAFPLVE
jgi:hypothetical protein